MRILIILFVATFASLMLSACTASETDRPNVFFNFADDWGWDDLICHGHLYEKMPNIDRLSAEGTDDRSSIDGRVCFLSRTVVMTGHFTARRNIDPHFAWVPSNKKRIIPDWLDRKAPLPPKFL